MNDVLSNTNLEPVPLEKIQHSQVHTTRIVDAVFVLFFFGRGGGGAFEGKNVNYQSHFMRAKLAHRDFIWVCVA